MWEELHHLEKRDDGTGVALRSQRRTGQIAEGQGVHETILAFQPETGL